VTVTLLASGCTPAGSSRAPSRATPTSEASAPDTATTQPSATSSVSPPSCPNAEGGECLGPLTAGTAYTTKIFTPQLTYRVSTPGWFNYEDTPGNFLLVPPRNDLPGVNAGTSDFLGVYTAIVPARVVEPDGCVIQPVPGTWTTPEAVAAWFLGRPDLRASRPIAVSIGGLRGVAVDLRTRPGAHLTTCRVEGQRFSLAGVFTGAAPSSLDHGVIPGMTMRLFLLSSAGGVLAIELDDIDQAPGGLAALTAAARHVRFHG
jgi:hypothetical protein